MIQAPVMTSTWAKPRTGIVLAGLGVLLVVVFILTLGAGAFSISVKELTGIFLHWIGIDAFDFSEQQERVLLSIRLPRILLGILVGGALGLSGAALQGLFRNPLVEPTLIGVTGGAALFAVIVIAFGTLVIPAAWAGLGLFIMPVFAFTGGLLVTLAAYRISKARGRTDIAVLILAGVALNALANAGIGLVIYFADDAALRAFTFWSLGDLGGASWEKLRMVAPLIMLPSIALMMMQRQLNALSLGESEAYHLGVNVERVKYMIIVLSALTVGAAVSVTGSIGFVGLVVPHLLRLAFGADHAIVLPGSFLGGAVLLMLADLFARTIMAPVEIPIGIVTALLGAPFFIMLLWKSKYGNSIR